MGKKEIDVGLIKNYNVYGVEYYKGIPLSETNQLKLNEKCKFALERAEKSIFYSNHRIEILVSFVENYKEQLFYRVFSIIVKIDRRKIEKYKLYSQEIFQCKEGSYFGMVRNCRVYNTNRCGLALKLVTEDENISSYYIENYHAWRFVKYDYLYGFVDYRMYGKEDLIKLKPELKYSMWDGENPIYYLNYYRMFPQIEFLRKCKFAYLETSKRCLNKLAKDKSFMKFLYKCYEENLTYYSYEEYVSYYKEYKMNLSEIIVFVKARRLKQSMNPIYYNSKKYKKIYSNADLMKTIKYHESLYEKNLSIGYYEDYLEMALNVGHDLKDDYWRYPSNLAKMHDKVAEEQKNVQETNRKIMYDMLHEVVKNMKKYDTKINGYDIFIPDKIEDVKKQCDTLYQCLIRNNYINKVIMQEEILVFIWKDGIPQATAQVFYNKEVGQFYADEHGHTNGVNCLPSKEVSDVFYKWLENFKPMKAKVDKKEKYFKGFYSKKSNGIFVGYKDYEFKIGGIYETNFDDNEIVSYGGEKCNATNKVFHFCNSIEEISKHYSPKYYCEVEPLGPVLECNGALLSNKIKIIKEVKINELCA
jgi:hypothetical protein